MSASRVSRLTFAIASAETVRSVLSSGACVGINDDVPAPDDAVRSRSCGTSRDWPETGRTPADSSSAAGPRGRAPPPTQLPSVATSVDLGAVSPAPISSNRGRLTNDADVASTRATRSAVRSTSEPAVSVLSDNAARRWSASLARRSPLPTGRERASLSPDRAGERGRGSSPIAGSRRSRSFSIIAESAGRPSRFVRSRGCTDRRGRVVSGGASAGLVAAAIDATSSSDVSTI